MAKIRCYQGNYINKEVNCPKCKIDLFKRDIVDSEDGVETVKTCNIDAGMTGEIILKKSITFRCPKCFLLVTLKKKVNRKGVITWK